MLVSALIAASISLVTAGSPASAGSSDPSVVALHSDKCLDVAGDSLAAGAPLIQYTCNSGSNQKFWFSYVSNGTYLIHASHSGLCLTDDGWGTADGTLVKQWYCDSNSPPEQWVIAQNGITVMFFNSWANLYMSVSGGSTADGAPVLLWHYTGFDNQKWLVGLSSA
jgi:hypothetical protein